jgi:hypothetical protein
LQEYADFCSPIRDSPCQKRTNFHSDPQALFGVIFREQYSGCLGESRLSDLLSIYISHGV